MSETSSRLQRSPSVSPSEHPAVAIVRVLATAGATIALTLHGDLPSWSAVVVLAGLAAPADTSRLLRLLRGGLPK